MKNVKSNREDITIVKNHFTYLNLGEIDPELNSFVEDNFEFFMRPETKTRTSVDILGNKRGIILRRNGSLFKLFFMPDYINPKYVTIELVNLDSHLAQEYTIDFAQDTANSVVVTYRKRFKSLMDMDANQSSLSKLNTETVYINGRKRYFKQSEHFIGKHINEDSSFSKEETICYSALDESYVKSYVAIAEPCAYIHSSISYEKYDGKDIYPISSSEFGIEATKFSEERAKVFAIRKDN